ncbi:MAG: hydrogenase iron-sulfur subunit, partial [Promethearchaeota archaeon]
FFQGADGVLIAGCYEQDCHYNTGFIKAKTRYESIREILAEAGINEKRVRIESISAGEGEKFAQVVKEFKEELIRLGPITPYEYERMVQVPEKMKESARLDEI